jgi:hypothetical protein
VYGTVDDSSGAVLPGATITLTGGTIGARSTTSGSQGDFRFLNLDPGTYTLAVSLTGFSTVKRSVIVNTGQSVTLSLRTRWPRSSRTSDGRTATGTASSSPARSS